MHFDFRSVIRKSFIDETKTNKNQEQPFADLLSSHIDDCLKKFRNSTDKVDDSYYGPFLNLVQSNWTGKSRVCWDMAAKNYVLYISFGNENCFPYRSSNSFDFLKNKRILSEQKKYFTDLINTFIYIVNYEKPSQADFFYTYSNNNTYSNNTKNRSLNLNLVINEKKEAVEIKLNEMRQSKDYNNEKLLEIRDEDDEALKKKLIFVFDNYTELLKFGPIDSQKSMFTLLRNVLAEINKKYCSFFGLFIDSINKHEYLEINNMIFLDPSKKNLMKTSQKLFDPIYMLPTWDLFTDMISINNIFDTVKIENVLCYGRPLWGSYLKVEKFFNENSILFYDEYFKDLKHQTVSKLLSNCSLPIKIENLSEEDLLAIVSARVGLIRLNSFTMREDLVFQNLAICSRIDQEKNLFECIYPSEPFLAMVSAECLNIEHYSNENDQVATRLWSNAIENIKNLFERSVIDLGDKSEFIVKLMLLLAVDESCQRSFVPFPLNEHCYLKAIKIRLFIEVLYGSVGIKLIEEQLSIDDANKFLDGYINFNHFMSSYGTDVSENDIECMLKRCVALHCDHPERSVDLVIPVCLDKDNISKSNMSAIFVVINPLNKDIDFNDDDLNMIETNQNPFLALAFDLTSDDEKIYEPEINSKKRAIISSSGFKFNRLFELVGEKISNSLIKLMNSKINLDQKFQSIFIN